MLPILPSGSPFRPWIPPSKTPLLWFGEILSRKLYQDLGYSSINQYAQQALGFSRTRTGDFLQLCRKLDKLPAIKREVAEGKLGYTKARELAKVADQKNETEWLELAKSTSRRELEHEVKRAKLEAVNLAQGQTSLLPAPVNRPAAVIPVRVCFEFTPEQFARYEALTEQLHKRGSAGGDKVEMLLQAMASLAAESAPRGESKARPFRSIFINVLIARKPPSRPAGRRWRFPHKTWTAPGATHRSWSQESEIPAPFRRRSGDGSWPAIGTVARAPAALTPDSSRSTTRSRAPGAEATTRKT